ncbi:hypothetical protein [Ktedonobacter racemifer]|uniref:M protein-like MukB domain-containing protein n=1 Tax=Ktedonobacter racemifer DSM 44963 TaxID=485913 RepID=D6TYX3_KTERA|nr:hypothetical protein [Ktedonobacter racemifer]EFH81763.1 M protein-like MukB domain-containing protein [Ktedonobacter racemifer DSM 44963]
MPTPEERIGTVEFDLRQFKTETIKAYSDMAYEMVIIKGLGEDSIKRLATLTGRVENIENQLEAMRTENNQRFDTIESMLAQILNRLPEK